MLSICICDDNARDVEDIRALAERFTGAYPEHSARLTTFSSSAALAEHMEKKGGFDLYLLDMLMPGLSGLELAERVRALGEPAEILFLTATREYAVEAFGVHAAGYLLKPVTQEAFDKAALHAVEALAPGENPSLLLKTGEGMRRVALKSLVMVESFDHRRRCTLTGGTVVETPDTLSSLMARLEGHGAFFSPHRAYIVNMEYVNGITNTDLLLTNGTRVPVAQKLYTATKRRICQG